jgi:hypothetical protein
LTRHRREALADVTSRYNVPIIEDERYGKLPFNALATFAELAPELTYDVTGLSKTLSAALRVGYLKAPTSRQTQHIAGAARDLGHAESVQRAARDAMDQRWHRRRRARFHSRRSGGETGHCIGAASGPRLRCRPAVVSSLATSTFDVRLERAGTRVAVAIKASARWPAPRFPPMAIRRMRCACVSAGRRIARIAEKR